MTTKPSSVIYVVSLKSAVDRQEIFARQAREQAAGLHWTFFPARTELSPDLRYNPKDALVARGRYLHDRELACYSSHFEAWKLFLQTNADQALIVEDDVHLDWIFVQRLLSHKLSEQGIDYLKLFNKNMTPYKVVSNNFLGRWLLDCRGFAYGMQAYLISRKAAQQFVTHCGETVRRPVDDELDRSWVHGIPNQAIFPFPAFERAGPSTIGADRDNFTVLPLRVQVERRRSQLIEKGLRWRQKLTGFGLARPSRAFPSRSFGVSHIQRELLE